MDSSEMFQVADPISETQIRLNENMQWQNCQRLFGEARTRISISYVVLMLFFTGVSIPAIRQMLFSRVEERIERSLDQEVEEFRRLTGGQNPRTGEPFGEDVAAIFDVFLSRNIPYDNEFLLTLLDGKLYKYSPKVLPEPLQPDSDLIQRWAIAIHPEKRMIHTSVGTIMYRVEPVIINQKRMGVFVVAYTTTTDSQEVEEAIGVVVQVMLIVLAVSVLLSWLAAGRVLAPLQLLTATARSISESDLTQRIPVEGNGDIAELAITFNEMMDRLQSAFASQRDFINDAGHELRTPVTIIRGHLELMSIESEEQNETRILLLDELDRMSRFVEDLILLAQAEQPDFLHLETIDISVLTEEFLAKGRALANRNWTLDRIGWGKMVGDRQRITQAVMNLAQNATQHTQESDTIALGSAINGQWVRFWVRDTGKGIDTADQKRIFERFARAANSYRRSEGAGLGLSIVKAIAEAHGGWVELRSSLGTGSTFIIVLPLELMQRVATSASNSHR